MIRLSFCLALSLTTVGLCQGQLLPHLAYNGDLSRMGVSERAWVDSVFTALTPDERLGQLFMIRAHSNLGPDHVAAVERMIREYQVGGLCFFQGTPEEQVRLTNQYQAISRLPLLVSMDAEWGLGMRLPASTQSFPRQLTLGAIQDNTMIYKMGAEIAQQLRAMGVHISFSPVLDVNNNPNNPVIGTRSFGEDRYNVTVKGYQYMRGLQDNGVMACAKHFPGHGDTDVDSHYDLPLIKHPIERLDSIEMYPFRALAQHGIGSFMVAHLAIPALEQRPNRPTTLSRYTITKLLRNDMRFSGLIFTDALEMKGVTKHFGPGEVEAESLVAGNDVLLLPGEIATALRSIKSYLAEGKLEQSSIDRSVRRILLAKYRLGLTSFLPLVEKDIRKTVNSHSGAELKQKLYERALTLVRDQTRLLPINNLDTLNLAAIAIGQNGRPLFQQRLADFAEMDLLLASSDPSAEEQRKFIGQLRNKDAVFVSLHAAPGFLEKVSVSSGLRQFLIQLQRETRVVLVVFGTPYALRGLDDIEHVVVAYSNDDVAQDVAAQAIFGAIGMSGRLPVTASPRSQFNMGLETRANFRMGYAPPERVGMNADTLDYYMDRIADEAIRKRATPGCVVLVARRGKIVFERAYGKHTYAADALPVQIDDLYDLASVTKVASTTLAVMKMEEMGLVDIDHPIGNYLPWLKASNKAPLTIREIMAHRAGLQSWIPFYKATLERGRSSRVASPQFYRTKPSGDFRIPITDRLYLHSAYMDSIYQQIAASSLPNQGRYRYSDLGFYLLANLVEERTSKTIDAFTYDNFYHPLGLHELVYRPLSRFSANRIVPTELDTYWRKQEVRGYVHDMGAAMMGGVSGHAGLFGTAHDLAVLMQMLLQNGIYGNRIYLLPETVEKFTTRYTGDPRRGIGFDMKRLGNGAPNMSARASAATFGHTGFTGICAWADPAEDLVFVFLSNRTYPSMRNYLLNHLNIRNRMQEAAYRAINPYAAPEAINRTLMPTART